ncbi:MAG TPA: sugar phosphate nucleotidyltransferase [Actinomycetota bacterium]|jgi:glucose-1-phosphate cytidylyltransferase
MKVVLFCGGLGTRIRDFAENAPKPLVRIGYRPILWHVMKYYAHFGHKDFILCLGYRADAIKDYFLHYDEALSNDFVLDGGGGVELLTSDIEDWRITFVDTGVTSGIGERLRRVRPHLEGEEVFLANYSDGLTDLDLPTYVESVRSQDRIASFLCVRPTQTFHVVKDQDGGIVTNVEPVAESDVWINAGFFLFKQEIFDYIREGEDLVLEPFERLIGERQLLAYKYTGFWTAMDTFKDRERLEDLWSAGKAPWIMW